MDALKSLVQPLVGGAGGSSVIDGVKLVVLGGTVETARRVSSSAWYVSRRNHFNLADSSSLVPGLTLSTVSAVLCVAELAELTIFTAFFLTAHFSEEDYPYDWLMLWLSRRPEWQRSREFETTTRTTTPGFSSTQTADNSFGDEEEDGDEDSPPGKVKTRVVFQPTADTTHTIYYRGHWLRVRRSKKTDGSGCEVLSIRYLFLFLSLFASADSVVRLALWLVATVSSSNSSSRRRRSTRRRPSTASRSTLRILMAAGAGRTPVTSVPCRPSS